VLLPINPRDAFNANVGQVYAIFHFHHLPPHATIEAVWTLPDGSHPTYPFGTSGAGGARYLWAEYDTAGPGHYSVAAVVNGKTVGSHDFTVKGKGNNGASQGAPAQQVQVANSVSSGVSKGNGKGHGRGRSKSNGKGHGRGEGGASTAA
jgi:hypothetical protein